MTKNEPKRRRGRERHVRLALVEGVCLLFSCLPVVSFTPTLRTEPSSDVILAKVAESGIARQAVAYSGLRKYELRNIRFAKDASVTVQVTYRPDVGVNYAVLERRGSAKLIEIVDKLLAAEADVSTPAKLREYEFSRANYEARLRGVETTGERICYVIELVPKHKSKYLIKGTAWVDQSSYAVVRLDGVTASSVSMWVGAPHILLDFSDIGGVWLPTHMLAASSGLFLGKSELEVHYTSYLTGDLSHPVATHAPDSVRLSLP